MCMCLFSIFNASNLRNWKENSMSFQMRYLLTPIAIQDLRVVYHPAKRIEVARLKICAKYFPFELKSDGSERFFFIEANFDKSALIRFHWPTLCIIYIVYIVQSFFELIHWNIKLYGEINQTRYIISFINLASFYQITFGF